LKPDDLDRQRPIAGCADHLADFADTCVRTLRLDQQSDRAYDFSHQRRELSFVERVEAVVERESAI
jgi:hypothetical protein